jgi:hypothetical protein
MLFYQSTQLAVIQAVISQVNSVFSQKNYSKKLTYVAKQKYCH